MNIQQAIAIATLTSSACLHGQSNDSESVKKSQPAHDASHELSTAGFGKDVTVVLPPPTSPRQTKPALNKESESSAQNAASKKMDFQPQNEASSTSEEEVMPSTPEESPEKPELGPSVRIERMQSGTGEADPSQVKVLAPFPAKLLARTPAGWRVESSKQAPHFTREVELSPGKIITLDIYPHLLVADADGSTVFQIAEPGFDAQLGYNQDATVGSILSNSVRHLETDSFKLGTAIEQLQQILLALPQPESIHAPDPKAQSVKMPKR